MLSPWEHKLSNNTETNRLSTSRLSLKIVGLVTAIWSYSVYCVTTHLLSIECADWPKLHDMLKARDAKAWQCEFPVRFPVRICASNLLSFNIFVDIVARIESRCVIKAKYVLLVCQFVRFFMGKIARALHPYITWFIWCKIYLVPRYLQPSRWWQNDNRCSQWWKFPHNDISISVNLKTSNAKLSPWCLVLQFFHEIPSSL